MDGRERPLVQTESGSRMFVIVLFACSLGSVVGVCHILSRQIVKDLRDRLMDLVCILKEW